MSELKTGTILRSANLMGGYHELFIELTEELGQKPGQHIIIHSNIPDPRHPGETVKKEYSVSCAPYANDPGHFSLTFALVGRMSRFLAGLKKGDVINFTGPHGDFYLDENITGPLYMAATGTGFSPICAMIACFLRSNREGPIKLWWQIENPYHWERMDMWKSDERFSKEIGTAVVHSVPADPSGFYYMAGNGKIIDDLIARLTAEGVVAEQISVEKFYTPGE